MQTSKKGILTFILLLFVVAVSAQTLELGLFGGGSYLITDVNPNKHFKDVKPAFGLVGRYYAGSRWAYRTSITTTTADSTDRLTDLSLVAEFNFFEYFTGSTKSYFTPFIFGGISTYLQQVKDPDENKPALSIPFGLGLKYSVNRRLGLVFEWRMQESFRDDMDGVSDKPNLFQTDWMNFTGISLIYRIELGTQGACKKFSQSEP